MSITDLKTPRAIVGWAGSADTLEGKGDQPPTPQEVPRSGLTGIHRLYSFELPICLERSRRRVEVPGVFGEGESALPELQTGGSSSMAHPFSSSLKGSFTGEVPNPRNRAQKIASRDSLPREAQ